MNETLFVTWLYRAVLRGWMLLMSSVGTEYVVASMQENRLCHHLLGKHLC